MARWRWVAPYDLPARDCLSLGRAPSQGIVYAINESIVAKLPIQYCLSDSMDEDVQDRLESTLQSLDLFAKEAKLYDLFSQNPHPNIARRLFAEPRTIIFIERLSPLEDCIKRADQITRYRWVTELCSAVAHLEALGYIHGDLAPRNIGTNGDSLKLFDFGTAIYVTDDGFDVMKREEYSALATCIHFILSAVDPFRGLNSIKDLRQLQRTITEGREKVHPDARILENIIRDCWSGPNPTTTFASLYQKIRTVLGVEEASLELEITHQSVLEAEQDCRNWLRQARTNVEWKSEAAFRSAL